MELLSWVEIKDSLLRSRDLSGALARRYLKGFGFFMLGILGVLPVGLGIYYASTFGFKLELPSLVMGALANFMMMFIVVFYFSFSVIACVLIPATPQASRARDYIFKMLRSHYHPVFLILLFGFIPKLNVMLGLIVNGLLIFPSLFPVFIFFDNPPSFKSLFISFFKGWSLWFRFLPVLFCTAFLGMFIGLIPGVIFAISSLFSALVSWLLSQILPTSTISGFLQFICAGSAFIFVLWKFRRILSRTLFAGLVFPYVIYTKIKERFPELFSDEDSYGPLENLDEPQ